MRKIVVTGGCGFIGSNFIRYLLQCEPDVYVINYDALTYAGRLSNVDDLRYSSRYYLHTGNVVDYNKLKRLLEGVDSIIHFAAETHVDRSIKDPAPFVKSNYFGTYVLLDTARHVGVRRFVQISTDEVYGSLEGEGAFTENSTLAPSSPYAATKASADLLVRSYHRTFGMDVVITRCSNNYGPRQYPEKMIPLFITLLLQNKPVPVYGDGKQVRDWIHVVDHCEAIHRVWRDGRAGEVYNIGGRNEVSNLEMVHMLLDVLKKPTALIKHVTDRLGHDRRYAVDCSKIERELGWKTRIALSDGLRDTVEWYRRNRQK